VEIAMKLGLLQAVANFLLADGVCSTSQFTSLQPGMWRPSVWKGLR